MTAWDWSLIGVYFLFSLGVGLYFSRRAGRNLENFFISGRSLPWWIAGTSMVATTFGADTPLAVTEIVAKNGIAGNWLWWNFVFGGMLTVFLFARLWRRSEVLTDLEFIELRYSGRPAALLRGFRALYLGLPINCMIMAWSILAMSSILSVFFAFPKAQAIIISLGIAVIYSVLSGFWGVVITDFVQFIMAMAGSVVLAVLSIQHVGGIGALKYKILAKNPEALNFFPNLGSTELPFLVFFVYIAVQWWSTWYPGSEPGGGGYVAQRMLATQNERHSVLATLWFNIAHYALRPWPWILVALASLVVFPDLADPKLGYPKMMAAFLPAGLKGLMMAAFFGAFMSTIDTHLNWGASYIINDFYKRFIRRSGSVSHYIFVSRLAVVLLMVCAGLTAYWMNSIKEGWEILLAIGAGTGLVSILRWFWWRINAWCEISATICSFIVAVVLMKTPLGRPGEWNWAIRMLLTVGVSTGIWVLVMFLTRPVSKVHLQYFFQKIQPQGFWKPFRGIMEKRISSSRITQQIINWGLGVILVYGMLFGAGKMLLLQPFEGSFFLFVAGLAAFFLFKNMLK